MDKLLIKKALLGKTVAEFSVADVNKSALEDILKTVGLSKDDSVQRILSKREEIFAIVTEALDEILPKDLQNILGQFAEVKQFARDADVNFRVNAIGKRRARLSIKKGARGGIYRAARLDNAYLGLETYTQTVGLLITIEDLLTGRVTFGELYQNILLGFEEKVYQEVIVALRSAKTLAKATHVFTNAGFDIGQIDQAIRVAKAYGNNVVILGFRSYLEQISNIVDFTDANPTIPTDDLADIRAQGIVRLYKGVPVVELPNFILEDGATATWAFGEGDLFILGSDVKPVKIALKGNMFIAEDKMPNGDMAWNAHKMMGVGLLLADYVCVVTDSTNTVTGTY